ncbi:MAG: hypothetical protein JO135_08695 [Candidatus Eremiobacteraeota bacterium]|nr:hypothetical protein [Candidatus Eremiobacteraeota bacterium]
MDYADLTLMPEVEARRILRSEGKPITLTILRPVFDALGRGRLRTLRVRPANQASEIEVVAGYDGYERIER